MGADNQQERLDTQWIVGFVDGEGCFYVGINYPRGYRQILPEFRIVQHQKDEALLYRIKNFFGCGSVTRNHGDRKEIRVRGKENLTKVVNFFEQYPLQTRKKKDFEKFAEIILIINENKHTTDKGFKRILKLKSKMNRQINVVKNPQRLYARHHVK